MARLCKTCLCMQLARLQGLSPPHCAHCVLMLQSRHSFLMQQCARQSSQEAKCPHSGAQVVSQAEAQGRVLVVALSDIQGKSFEQPTVVIAETVGGMEDIPVISVQRRLAYIPSSLLEHMLAPWHSRLCGHYGMGCSDRGPTSDPRLVVYVPKSST